MTMWKKVRLVAAWLAGAYLARMMVQMGWVKFDPDGFWTAAFERWGYPVWLRQLVGAIEVGGGIAMIIPWIASWGGLAVAVVMGGAWVTRAGDGRWVDVAWITVYMLGCLWVAFEWWSWRRPRLPSSSDPVDASPTGSEPAQRSETPG